jgi:hypothetical protein
MGLPLDFVNHTPTGSMLMWSNDFWSLAVLENGRVHAKRHAELAGYGAGGVSQPSCQ